MKKKFLGIFAAFVFIFSAALFNAQIAHGEGQMPPAPSFDIGGLFQSILNPIGSFFEILTHVGAGGSGSGEPTQTQFSNFDLGEFLSRFDARFQEITGISISQFLKAIIGIFIWIFNAFIKLLQWLLAKV